MTLKILVLAKEVPDTATARTLDPATGMLERSTTEPLPDEINERALEQALRRKDADKTTEIVVLAMGPATAEKSLRKLLAMGADTAVLIADERVAGADAIRTSQILARAITEISADLVLAGTESTDGSGGVVPSMIAELCNWPVMPSLHELNIGDEGVTGLLSVEGESIDLSANYPSIVSITEQSAEPRFPNFKGIMKAKKKPLDIWNLDDIGAIHDHPASSVMVSAQRRPERQAGVKVVDDGTATDQLIAYLTTNRLI